MDPLEELSFNISWPVRFVSGSSWDDEICKSSCHSVSFTQMHFFFSDNKKIPEFSKSSRKNFAFLSISQMSWKNRFLLSDFLRVLLWKSLGAFENGAVWIFSDWPLLIDSCSELLIDFVLSQSAITSTLQRPFGIHFTNNFSNLTIC